MKNTLPFHKDNPACKSFQYLEDLSTAYWYSEVFFSAIELNIFKIIGKNELQPETIAKASGCRAEGLLRILKVLKRIGLLIEHKGLWSNSQIASIYLLPENSSYMGDFFLYRRYMQPAWKKITKKIAKDKNIALSKSDQKDDYDLRTFNYVRAMDMLARQKAEEIVNILKKTIWKPPVLDIGGGAGALSRAIIGSYNDKCNAVLLELPEIIRAAKSIYPDSSDWNGIKIIEKDFRKASFEKKNAYGLVILCNFLHAYGSKEAETLLYKAVCLAKQDGMILIHDYFPDRLGKSPHKGAFYDINMMLNTYNGRCHTVAQIKKWLANAGIESVRVVDLETDSSLILAVRSLFDHVLPDDDSKWVYEAMASGFENAVKISASLVITAHWARTKCKFGCSVYGKNLQCPPCGIESDKTKKILNSYSTAIVLEGGPPGIDFHKKLLELEKKAFLAGYYKAIVFGAGHCPVCKQCPEDGKCLHPDLARPSMEGSGIDVYATAQNAGIELKPVKNKGDYVKYIGLLLLE